MKNESFFLLCVRYVKVGDTPVGIVEERDEKNRKHLESIVIRLETAYIYNFIFQKIYNVVIN